MTKRRKKNLKFGKALLVSMLLTLTIALGGCAGDKEADNSSQITIGIPQDLNSLDPNNAVGSGTIEVLFNIYESLYKPDSQGNLIPAVASDMTISEDGKTYTFTLREGIKFHNGESVTVEDIKYSIEKGADAGLVSAFSNMESVEIVDDSHVAIKLMEVDNEFLAKISTVEAAIVPAGVTDIETNPVGTGPYKFVSRSLQENVVLEKFDEYWGTPANIEKVVLKVIADSDAIVMNLEGGAIDMFARVTSTQAAELGENFEILEGTMNLVQAMYLNNAVEPFNNEQVRQALCYAIDKSEILAVVADGKGTEIGSSMYPAFGKYYMPELNELYPHNVEKAKALLTEAGYADGFTFKLTVPSNYTQHVDTATVIAEQLKEVGVIAEIELIEWESWLSDVYIGRQYEATVVGVDASTLTASALLGRFSTTAKNNFINFDNAKYDTAYANAQATSDDALQTQYYKECETILAETAANVYIQDMAEFVAINKKYAGYEFYPLYVQDFAKLYIVE